MPELCLLFLCTLIMNHGIISLWTKGIYMKFKHFDDIKTNTRVNFIMAYFAVNRALSRLEYRLHKSYKGHIPYCILKELLKIRQKSNQMAAVWKKGN